MINKQKDTGNMKDADNQTLRYFVQALNGNYKVLESNRPNGPKNYKGVIEEVFETKEEALKYIRLQEVMNIYSELDNE